MDLVRDLLDKQVMDRNGREMGRVDSIAIDVRKGAPPRVVAIELGIGVLGYRIAPIIGRWMAAVEYACGATPPGWIPFGDILTATHQFTVDRAAGDTTPRPVEAPLYVDRLLGRAVVARNNRPVGRIEEFRADIKGKACTITDVVIGAAGLAERLGVGIRLLLGFEPSGHLARWDQIDLTDVEHPRLLCALEDLREA